MIKTKTFVTTIANDLVSVKPMSTPIGTLFYVDFQYKVDMNHLGILI